MHVSTYLYSIEGGHTDVEEYAIEHGEREQSEDVVEHQGDSDQDRHCKQSHTLLSEGGRDLLFVVSLLLVH